VKHEFELLRFGIPRQVELSAAKVNDVRSGVEIPTAGKWGMRIHVHRSPLEHHSSPAHLEIRDTQSRSGLEDQIRAIGKANDSFRGSRRHVAPIANPAADNLKRHRPLSDQIGPRERPQRRGQQEPSEPERRTRNRRRRIAGDDALRKPEKAPANIRGGAARDAAFSGCVAHRRK